MITKKSKGFEFKPTQLIREVAERATMKAPIVRGLSVSRSLPVLPAKK